jgi:uncharacterized protein (DUF1015 family)
LVDFHPFRGVRYDLDIAGAMSDLVCPPYDVISSNMERTLLGRNPHNMVRLELSELEGAAVPGRYSGAARFLESWSSTGILNRDLESSYYLLRQKFAWDGSVYERYGFFGVMRLHDLGGDVLPHEHTAPGPKMDRLELMKECQANFSPVMGLFRDSNDMVKRIRVGVETRDPYCDFNDSDGQQYTLWKISKSEEIGAIREALESEKVYIADGHHRYETAVAYRDIVRTASSPAEESASEFVMTCLIAFDDPGLLVLPYHRVIHGLSPAKLNALRGRLTQVFNSENVSIKGVPVGKLKLLLEARSDHQMSIGMIESGLGSMDLLTLESGSIGTEPQDLSSGSGMSEVESWVLQELVLRPVLGESFTENVSYVYDVSDAIEMLKDGAGQMAFILNGVATPLFERIVGQGIRLPRKSTFFYPKLPSGIVINPLG